MDPSDTTNTYFDRRTALRATVSIGTTIVTGCLADSAESAESDTSTDKKSNKIPLSEEKYNTADFGSGFVIGNDHISIEIEITYSTPARAIGTSDDAIESKGIYNIVKLEVDNFGDRTTQIERDNLQLINQDGNYFDPLNDIDKYIKIDTAYDSAFSFGKIKPGTKKEGVIVFDVVKDKYYSFVFNPEDIISDGKPHIVTLGTIPISGVAN